MGVVVEFQMPEPERRSDRLLREVIDRLERNAQKWDNLQLEISEFNEFRAEYIKKSLQVGDPHRWIETVGQPTARDFNRIKTGVLAICAAVALLYGLVKGLPQFIIDKFQS